MLAFEQQAQRQTKTQEDRNDDDNLRALLIQRRAEVSVDGPAAFAAIRARRFPAGR